MAKGIEKRGNHYRAVIRLNGKKETHTTATQQQAEAWLIRMKQKKLAAAGGAVLIPSKETLATVIDDYIRENGNWGFDKEHHLKHLRADLGHHSLSQLSKPVIYDYIKGLGKSP